MKLYLLGTAGYHPSEDRHTACFMVPEAGLILDAGTGFFRVRDLIATPELHIFLGHAHLDHCIGLTFYLGVLYERNVRSVSVYGEPAKLEAIRTQLFSEHLFPLLPDFQWIPLDGRPIAIPRQGLVHSFSLEHPGGSTGFRVDWPGHRLAYVTDTTASVEAAYVDAIRDVDLLIHECNFRDEDRAHAECTGHSTLADVARVCQTARVRRSVLVHINPLDEADLPLESVRNIFEGLCIGRDQMVVDF